MGVTQNGALYCFEFEWDEFEPHSWDMFESILTIRSVENCWTKASEIHEILNLNNIIFSENNVFVKRGTFLETSLNKKLWVSINFQFISISVHTFERILTIFPLTTQWRNMLKLSYVGCSTEILIRNNLKHYQYSTFSNFLLIYHDFLFLF